MDKRKKSGEGEFFPMVESHRDRVVVFDYDREKSSNFKAVPAQFQTLFLRDFLHVVFKRKFQILLFIIVAFLAGAIDIYRTIPTYRASAKLLVKVDRESIYEPGSNSIRPAGDRQINSEIEILKGRSLAEKTIEALGPKTIYPESDTEDQGILDNFFKIFKNFIRNIKDGLKGFLERFIPEKRTPQMPVGEKNNEVVAVLDEFQDALGVSSIEDSNLIEVNFTHEDPQMAATVVNRLADIYLDHHLTVAKTPQFSKFIQEQTQLLKNKLQKSENKLKFLKQQHAIISLGEERSLMLGAEAALLKDMNQNLSAKIETEKRIQLLKKQLAATPSKIQRGEDTYQNQSLISSFETKLVELEIKENELKSKFSEMMRDPELKNVKEEIRVVRKKLEEYEKKQHRSQHSGENPTYRRLHEELLHYEAELKAFRAKAAVQKTQLANYQHKLEKLNEVEVELDQLQQEIDANRQNYLLYMNKFEESRISEAMDAQKIASVFLVESAKPPLNQEGSGSPLRNLLLVLIIGSFGGLGLALCREYLSDRMEKVEDVEECLQLPVLASIPEFKIKS